MRDIIDDFINMTQGQLLVKYWWVWAIVLIMFVVFLITNKRVVNISRKIKTKNNKYESISADAYIGTEKELLYIRPSEQGNVRLTTNEKQLDRIEKKLDRVLLLLEKENLP